jgi:predicted TPR repeat methyltransferase
MDFSAEYWNREAKSFDAIYNEDGSVRGPLNRLLRRDMEGRYRFALSAARLDSRPRVLEIGCGTGIHTRGFLEAGAESVTGVDISRGMLGVAAARLEKYGGRARLIEGDFMTTRLDGEFDVVTAIGVFDYVAEPATFMARAMSFASGCFIATFPRAGTLRALIRSIRLALKRCPVYFYGERRVDELAAGCGAETERRATIGQLHCRSFVRSMPCA